MKILGETERKRLNGIIFETSAMPFGINAYNPNEPVRDFVGRREELFYLKEKIQLVWEHKISRAVRLDGPAGVGKSTLFNFLKESIEKERSDSLSTTNYLSRDTDIISTYLQAPEGLNDFRDLWKPMLEGLYAGFTKETSCDIGLPDYVAFRLVYKMFKNDPETIAGIIWPDDNVGTRLQYVEFKDIIEPIQDGGEDTVALLREYYRKNKRSLRKLLKTEISGVKYEVKRADNKLIIDLLGTMDEDDPDNYLEKINEASRELFSSTDEIIKFFNDLMRLYACGTGKRPLLLFGIDEVAKTEDEVGEEYYRMLGNLFVRLRNNLNSILFIFISTTEDWAKYDNIILKKSDLHNQISVFLSKLVVKQLSVDEMINVFKNRMNRFWGNYPSEKPIRAPYYPFSSDVFDYIYRFEKRNLRKSIQFLHELWRSYRYKRYVPEMATKFDCMRILRPFAGMELMPSRINKFEWDIITAAYNDNNRFRTSALRSSAVEKGLEYAWRCLMNEQGSNITRIDNNPRIKTASGTRRPDVTVEIHGNMGAEYRRVVEFQVKAYSDSHYVSYEHIASSLELFDEEVTDMIYFIITGKGLDTEAEYRVRELETKYQARIRRPRLSVDQKRNLYFLALYEEVTGNWLGYRGEKDLEIAKDILSTILMQPVESFLAELAGLAYRKPAAGAGEIVSSADQEQEKSQEISRFIGIKQLPVETEEKAISEPMVGESSVATAVGEKKPVLEGVQPGEEINWLVDYPDIKRYKYEACGLCMYLKTREGKRYEGKFTIATVMKNVIRKDANYDPQKFKELVKYLEKRKYLEKIRTSFSLTDKGKTFYLSLKKDNFEC